MPSRWERGDISSSLAGHSRATCSLGSGARWQPPHFLSSSERPLWRSASATLAREASSAVAGGGAPTAHADSSSAQAVSRRRDILRLKIDFSFASVKQEAPAGVLRG